MTSQTDEDLRRAFYDYFELCEEELYCRATHRVGRAACKDWWEGMSLHLQRPAFRAAWDEISEATAGQATPPDRRRLSG